MATTINRTRYTCETTRQESPHNVLGVTGRRHNLVRHKTTEPNQRIRNQRWTSQQRPIPDSDGDRLRVTIRHDDELLNGHPSFSITGDIHDKNKRHVGGGCCHDLIALTFPELKPLIKWHLCSTDGPMHYPANVLYHAGDRDYNGRLAGELQYLNELPARDEKHRESLNRKVTHGRDIPAKYDWQENYRRPDEGEEHTDGAIRRWLPVPMINPTDIETFELKALSPLHRIGEGKTRDLDAARQCAIWPEATDYELSSSRQVLDSLLLTRLPALLADFRNAIESIGFEFE